MWAAWIDEFGPPERIRYGELPVPSCGPTDVLVRVEAVAVNPADTFIRSGAYRTPIPIPFVIGRDLAGTVAASRPRPWASRSASPSGATAWATPAVRAPPRNTR